MLNWPRKEDNYISSCLDLILGKQTHDRMENFILGNSFTSKHRACLHVFQKAFFPLKPSAGSFAIFSLLFYNSPHCHQRGERGKSVSGLNTNIRKGREISLSFCWWCCWGFVVCFVFLSVSSQQCRTTNVESGCEDWGAETFQLHWWFGDF